jgi:hypothetical protein
MSRNDAPPELSALADARAAARRERDWPTADALKAQIEAAGWRVIDTGSFYDLERAAAPDLETGGIVRYGSSGSVPSRLAEAPVGVATVVLVATDQADELVRAVGSIADHAPDGTRIVLVVNGAPEAVDAVAASLEAADPGSPGIVTEVVRTSTGLGRAAALNAGIRRATTPLVLLLDPSVELAGDLVSVLADALDDPTVAVAGPFGLVSDDMRPFRPARPDALDADAIEGAAIAFRRADYVVLGPLDEHFTTEASLDAWWSLVLRDWSGEPDGSAGAEQEPGAEITSRRAVQAGAGLVIRHPRDLGAASDTDRERRVRRDRYRLLKQFATRRDLLAGR